MISCISPAARDILAALGHLRHSGGRIYQLHDLRVGGSPVAPLEVRVNAAVSLLGFEGIVGLNFLNRFRAIHFEVESGLLTLTLP